jgi:PAS domain-containing protein
MELVSLLTPVEFQAKPSEARQLMRIQIFRLLTVLCLQLPFTFAQEAATTRKGRSVAIQEERQPAMFEPSNPEVFMDSRSQSEEQLLKLIENVKDYAIFMLDPRGRVATWNFGAERLKGYTAKKLSADISPVSIPPKQLREANPSWSFSRPLRHGNRFYANLRDVHYSRRRP